MLQELFDYHRIQQQIHYCLKILRENEHTIQGDVDKVIALNLASQKESACGCAGIYSAPVALALYTEAFDKAGALDKLEAFASLNGPDFYKLPRNTKQLILKREQQTVPESYEVNGDRIKP